MRSIQLIKEELMLESAKTDVKKVEKLAAEVNKLIASAMDSDGDPLEVIDPTTTWEEGAIYKPFVFKNGVLKMSYKDASHPYKQHDDEYDMNDYLKKGDDSEMYYKYEEAIDTLRYVKRMYNKAIKQNKNK